MLTDFGQTDFGQFWCFSVSPIWTQKGGAPKGGAPKGGGPKGGGPKGGGPEPRKSGAPKGGAPKGGAPEGWGPRRVGARTVGAQNFALFFPSPATVFILFSLSFGLFRGILVVFEAPGRSNVHVWSSRAVVCEPRRPGLVGPPGFGPPGFHTTAREPKRAPRSSKTPPKFNEKDQQEREKRMKTVAGEGKKRAKFWAVRRRGGVRRRGPEHTHHTQQQQHNNNTTQQQHSAQQHRNTQHTTHNTQHNNNNNT